MDKYNLFSFFGIFVLTGFAWLCSADKKRVNWRVVVWGISLQILIAVFIFVVPAGTKFFLFVNDAVIKILDSAAAGSRFVFGRLALAPGQVNEAQESSLGFILAFQAFPTIIFFSGLISILYFLNIMPRLIKAFAYIFTKFMKVSGAESLVCASNCFVGIESAIIVKPHLNEMTHSELCTVLTAGMATVASNVLGIYIYSLKPQFPAIAGHLISASLLSVPASLVMSKLIFPENAVPKTLGEHIHPHYDKENNLFEAVINGSNAGMQMIIGIAALLIAVLGLVALSDLILSVIGVKLNALFNIDFQWAFKNILGFIFYPFTLILGMPVHDAKIISGIIGERLIVTEVAAYQDLANVLKANLLQSPRSAVIAAYALCGFAHLASMAIFVGGVSALAPRKTKVISEVALRALLAATLACLMTAAIAGTFFINNSVLLGN